MPFQDISRQPKRGRLERSKARSKSNALDKKRYLIRFSALVSPTEKGGREATTEDTSAVRRLNPVVFAHKIIAC